MNASRHTDGVSSIHVAAQNGHHNVVKLLLDNNANVNVSRVAVLGISIGLCYGVGDIYN